jgi:uncharacterized membrane protein
VNARESEIATTMPADLDSLPRLDGFRLRGLEMTRLETFIDAAFAFAITMLVIAVNQTPEDAAALLAAFKNVPAFITSVFVVSTFWRGHWLWSRRYGLEDGRSILISWAMMVTILIYIYPLKAVFSAMWFLLTDGRVGHRLGLVSEMQARAIFAVFAIGFAATALEILLLNLRAWQLRVPLRLNEREKQIAWNEVMGWALPTLVGLLSLVLALTLPIRHLTWSGWVYFSLFVLVRLNRARCRRKLAATNHSSEFGRYQ